MTRRYALIASGATAAVVLVLSVAIAVFAPVLFGDPPRDALKAAVSQYEQQTGLREIRTVGSFGWSKCAIVYLSHEPNPTAVAMIKTGDSWHLAQIQDDSAPWPDSDDLQDQASCLDIARTGVSSEVSADPQ